MRIKILYSKVNKTIRFPDRKTVNDSYTHDLERLLNISGLKVALDTEIRTNPLFAIHWTIVKDWSEQSRYDLTIAEATARDFYNAVTDRGAGVLPWIKKRW